MTTHACSTRQRASRAPIAHPFFGSVEHALVAAVVHELLEDHLPPSVGGAPLVVERLLEGDAATNVTDIAIGDTHYRVTVDEVGS